MPMTLPSEWKEIYLRSLKVPVLGPRFFGPVLRGFWRAVQFFDRARPEQPQLPDGLLTTYASAIDSLRRHMEHLEHRTAALERELAHARESAAVQQMLTSAALQGLQRRLREHEEHAGFRGDVLAAAISGLRRRHPADEHF